MSEFSIDTKRVKGQVEVLAAVAVLLNNNKDKLDGVMNSISLSGGAGSEIKGSLRKTSENLDKIRKSTSDLKSGLSDIVSKYTAAEIKISGTKIQNGPADSASSSNSNNSYSWSAASGSSTYTQGGVTYNADGSVATFEAGADAQASVDANGASASAQANAAFSGAQGSVSATGDYGCASASASVLTASAAAAASAGLSYNNGTLSGNAQASASASAAVASADAKGQLGTDDNNIRGEASGSVVGAEASAEAGISVNENGTVSAKAEAGAEAYLAKGEVSGGFSFLGIDVGGKLEGMVGVQAEAGGEVSNAGVEFNVGLGPVEIGVEIDWSDFDPIFWD